MSKNFTRIGIIFIALALALTIFNIVDSNRAKRNSDNIIQQFLAKQSELKDALDKEFYMQHSDISVPFIEIDGIRYIGIINIPAYGLELPVASETSESLLRLSPCRYDGTVYNKDLIIAGHNYMSHFNNIKNLRTGDEVYFTDAGGNTFYYQVLSIEEINGRDVESMYEGQWDMSLFTCTTSGKSRFTLRCRMIE